MKGFRGLRLVALSIGLTNVGLLVTAFALATGSDRTPVAVVGTFALTLTGLGGLIAIRQAQNPIGWLMQASGFFIVLLLFSGAYGSYGVAHPMSLPAYRHIASISLWAGLPGFALLIFVFLLFPTGTFVSRFWRWLAYVATVGIVLGVSTLAIRPGPIPNNTQIENPLGVPAMEDLARSMEWTGGDVLSLIALASIGSLFIRFRRSRGVERQQMKWFVLSVALFPVIFGISAAVQAVDRSEEEYLGFLIIMAGLLLVPISMAVGVLRYRLYDIDVIVNRTLVYGILTAILAACYFGMIVLMQGVLPLATDSDLAVATSTLVAAALFRPLRTRVQSLIDRRFYRNKYNAQHTLERFSQRLRDQVDLDALGRELIGVVGTTMQPAHASLWLRRGSEARP